MFADVYVIGMRRPAAACLNMVIRGASEVSAVALPEHIEWPATSWPRQDFSFWTNHKYVGTLPVELSQSGACIGKHLSRDDK